MELFGFQALTLVQLLLIGVAACASIVVGALLALHFVRFSSLHMTVLTIGVYTAGCILLLVFLVGLLFA